MTASLLYYVARVRRNLQLLLAQSTLFAPFSCAEVGPARYVACPMGDARLDRARIGGWPEDVITVTIEIERLFGDAGKGRATATRTHY